jgi:predicted nuclease of predicted toxin-antitoxin system
VKLLFDHNLSPALVRRVADLFPSSEHVYKVGLERAKDLDICEYAAANDFVIVTKDADYKDLLAARRHATSIVLIQLGNCSTPRVETVIRDHAEQILAFAAHDAARLLILVE